MTRERLVLCLFVVLAMCQLAVPSSMIAKREMTLRHGEVFLFKAAPVDPEDPFRGRYVALRYEVEAAWLPFDTYVQHGSDVFVSVQTGDDGFARLTDASSSPPAAGAYLRVGVAGLNIEAEEGKNLRVDLPFDRFYMNERLAPQAESTYRQLNRDEITAHVAVRVRNGFGVLEELYFDGKPVREYLGQSG